MIAPKPLNEAARLEALRRYDILDTGFEDTFDRITELACFVCETPIAAISLVDDERQWFKAVSGLDVRQTHRDVAFCAHAILAPDQPLIVEDATQDPRFRDNALVTGAPGIRFYAAIPLVTGDGMALGTLCVIDRRARSLSDKQVEALRTLAQQTMGQLDLRHSVRKTRDYVDAVRLAELVYNNSPNGMVITDPDNRIIAINPAFTTLTGYGLDEVIGKNPSFLRSGRHTPEFFEAMWRELDLTGEWHGELWNTRKNGEVYAEWLTISRLCDDQGRPHRFVGLFSDITEKKKSEEVVWRQANFDMLTGLPNRQLFSDRLTREIHRVHREKETLALMFLDLDHFKEVNDTYGHHCGDAVLVEAAQRISASVRKVDTVARHAGDEFTIILSDVKSPSFVEPIARKILDSLSQPFRINDQTSVRLSASIGIVLYPAASVSPDILLEHADKAMYHAKSGGRNRFAFFA